MNRNIKASLMCFVVTILMVLLMAICVIQTASANSGVIVVASSDGGTFEFEGDGAFWDWSIDVEGFDEANVDLTNHWDHASSTVTYHNIGDGEIHLKVSDRNFNNEWYYYDWDIIRYDGDGVHEALRFGDGGRSANVSGSPNVTTYIEQVVDIRKAVFLFDTSHSSADLTVVVHNGHLLENASVILMNGAREVQWTDEIGEAEFSPHTGKYAIIIEHENYTSMIVDDLHFESDKSYHIRVNMTDCLSSCGAALCASDADDLIMYYKQKEPAMGPISPQGYVNYFAKQLTTCKVGDNLCADGTLERMATKWGVYPDTPLNVLLYDCEFKKLDCEDGKCRWDVTYAVKNYQQYACNYEITLFAGNKTVVIGNGELGPAGSTIAKEIANQVVVISGEPKKLHLGVMSEKIGD